MKKIFVLLLSGIFCCGLLQAQHAHIPEGKKVFTHADTLRGTNGENRAWWDVLRYNITVKPDYETQTISGKNTIAYRVINDSNSEVMQIDLQAPLQIDSVFQDDMEIKFEKIDTNVWLIHPTNTLSKMYIDKVEGGKGWTNMDWTITIYYHGKPRVAVNPPWDGGWIWAKDSLGRPWMTVACEGLGASAWYPCKDYLGDEPDSGASLTMIVPDTMTAVANGRLVKKTALPDSLTSYTWAVMNPINNYDIIPYIGKYVYADTVYDGLKGRLDMGLWALDYDMAQMKAHCEPDVFKMLKALEWWYGAYPFYEDGYKLVQAPHLGMEHQSAIAYGNHFLQGYLGHDLSHTGIGLKFDFIVVHESGHEWFGNSITAKDLADMWIHESFTNYCESLFIEYYWGKDSAMDYLRGIRENIANDKPIIGHYGVNDEGSGDMYYKGANMLNNIRLSIDDDKKFRALLQGLNAAFYHQTVTAKQIEDYISQFTGIDFGKTFEQYLTTTQIPVLELRFSNDRKNIFYRYTNCVDGFDMPLVLHDDAGNSMRLSPTTQWQSKPVKTAAEANMLNPESVKYQYYLNCQTVSR